MKIYTRRGDAGETDLYGGGRVSKGDARMNAIGTVDEINAHLGDVLASNPEKEITSELIEIQRDLFVVGADLATIGEKAYRGKKDVPRVNDGRVAQLEEIIDRLDALLEPMTAFILPGGAPSAAKLHVARTVCRRAERLCVEIMQGTILKYLNRLSDLLFVMARYENARKGIAEEKWI